MSELVQGVAQAREEFERKVAERNAEIPADRTVESLRRGLAMSAVYLEGLQDDVAAGERALGEALGGSVATIEQACEFIRSARDPLQPTVGQVVRLRGHSEPRMVVEVVRPEGWVDVVWPHDGAIRHTRLPIAVLDAAPVRR
jgi:hypothetical protein